MFSFIIFSGSESGSGRKEDSGQGLSDNDELMIRTNSGTTNVPYQLPNVLEAEKDDLRDPR
jgi:hypothetical protein